MVSEGSWSEPHASAHVTAQIVKTVERILYAVDDEEAKNIIADANCDAQAYRAGAAASDALDAAAE